MGPYPPEQNKILVHGCGMVYKNRGMKLTMNLRINQKSIWISKNLPLMATVLAYPKLFTLRTSHVVSSQPD
jgi:hypothetical protein